MSHVVSLQAFGTSRPLQTVVESTNTDTHPVEPNHSRPRPESSSSWASPTPDQDQSNPHSSRWSGRLAQFAPSPKQDRRPPLFHPDTPRTSSLPQTLPHDSDSSGRTSTSLASPPESSLANSARASDPDPASVVPPSTRHGGLEHEKPSLSPQDDYDLAAPLKEDNDLHRLEDLSNRLCAPAHLRTIFAHPSTLLDFTSFLSVCRPRSVPLLMFYLDATEALKAATYAIHVTRALETIPAYDFTAALPEPTWHLDLKDRADKAFAVLAQQDLPAFVTQVYVQTVKSVLSRRAIGPSSTSRREMLRGMLEVFCLTDPSRPDNPIVFASEAFQRMTEYGLGYVIGRNCRFLQGPQTHRPSVQRIGTAIEQGHDHCEIVLNYRRDGSPFLNLLMLAPLRDGNGKIRYYLGAQVDVSDLVPDTVDPDGETGLQQLPRIGLADAGARRLDATTPDPNHHPPPEDGPSKAGPASTHESGRDGAPSTPQLRTPAQRPAAVLRHSFPDGPTKPDHEGWVSGKLSGFYHHYLLIRPYPSLRVLFASPSLQSPGMVQSPIMDRLVVASGVRDELLHALQTCRSVTVKAKWIATDGEVGHRRWVAFTPLVGGHMQVGVWVAIVMDDESDELHKLRPGPSVRVRVGGSGGGRGPTPAGGIPGPSESSTGLTREQSPVSFSEPARSLRSRSRSRTYESPPSSPKPSSIAPSISALVPEIDETYESLEERLMKKRGRDAALLRDHPGAAAKPTYKSLSPYAFTNNE